MCSQTKEAAWQSFSKGSIDTGNIQELTRMIDLDQMLYPGVVQQTKIAVQVSVIPGATASQWREAQKRQAGPF